MSNKAYLHITSTSTLDASATLGSHPCYSIRDGIIRIGDECVITPPDERDHPYKLNELRLCVENEAGDEVADIVLYSNKMEEDGVFEAARPSDRYMANEDVWMYVHETALKIANQHSATDIDFAY